MAVLLGPHPDIFRVSNDETEGCVGVGCTGWHIDGTFQWRPFKYQTMHFHSTCEGGETWCGASERAFG